MAASMRQGVRMARLLSHSSPHRYATLGNGKILRIAYLERISCGLRLQSNTAGSDSGSDSDKETPAKTQKPKLNLAKPTKKHRTPAAQPKEEEKPEPQSELGEQMLSAAQSVAESLGGDTEKTQSDLLKQLQGHAALTEAQKQGQPPTKQKAFKSVLSGMKLDQERALGWKRKSALGTPAESSEKSIIGEMMAERSGGGRMTGTRKPWSPDRHDKAVELSLPKLFDGPGLDIFTQPGKTSAETKAVAETKQLSLYQQVEREELDKMINLQPIASAWEEMIRWTEEGKLWKFPRDNEQGMDEEANVGFHEHVFLDHLIDDFPSKGPIRHFMDLVVTGLSQNPYLTVQQKHEHINWFRNYFEEKQELIAEAMKDATVVVGQ